MRILQSTFNFSRSYNGLKNVYLFKNYWCIFIYELNLHPTTEFAFFQLQVLFACHPSVAVILSFLLHFCLARMHGAPESINLSMSITFLLYIFWKFIVEHSQDLKTEKSENEREIRNKPPKKPLYKKFFENEKFLDFWSAILEPPTWN